jgi:hypothetical protein
MVSAMLERGRSKLQQQKQDGWCVAGGELMG